MNDIPVLNKSAERKLSIINDTPAIFTIVDSDSAVGRKPLYEIDSFSEVGKWCGLIIHQSKKHGVDPRLVAAIMYMETTHGWYDKVYPLRKTILPMNLHYSYWKGIGVTKEALGCPYYNIEFGITLLSRIQARIENPTIRKIATIYNFLGAEVVSDYGARVAKLYLEQPWSPAKCAV
ncbi:hypothetical protein [Vibrio parahaemolyticus]|uniref:hypothetical protein n=1 Tax=Vibrio parahaemolyticus TaxID=670 RepID=UPI0027E4E767|nr:hypothetical protein [Vibrio parahaemolyticus]WMN64993.1 hypothetical protein NI388_07675 [Vibrio parahaemolyticus]WMN75632.1 hypothetical protein NI386_15755 [Vibrio parahaemolyticus]